jgi:hypothetical protein
LGDIRDFEKLELSYIGLLLKMNRSKSDFSE